MQGVYNARFSLWREKWKILVALFFFAAALSSFSSEQGASGFFGVMIFVAIIVVWIVIDFLKYKLSVDDTVLKGTESVGLFGRSVSLPVKQISAVATEQKGLFGRILNFGTIRVTTASGIVYFRYVKRPREVENEILMRM